MWLQPPEGVRVTHQGRTYDLDGTMRYLGKDGRGSHVWAVYGPADVQWRIDGPQPELTVDALPGRTALRLAVTPCGDRLRFSQPPDDTQPVEA